MPRNAHRVDADFAEEILAELYAYRPKRRWAAFLLWGTLGLVGAHRFYLDRPGSGLLMAFTLGGGFVWWMVDAFRIAALVRDHNAEQDRRRREGLPPLELAFMPPLAPDVLAQPPAWTERWRTAGRKRRAARLAGDVLVLLTAGTLLGIVAKRLDVWEAVFAVFVLAALTAAGTAVGRFGHLPVIHELIRWSHRLRLFYYYATPGNPLGLLFRAVTAAVSAPLRRRDRAEVRLYLQLSGMITVAFLLLDAGREFLPPLLRGQGMPGLMGLAGFWITEATLTFIVIYAFAAPIGAVLTLYLLVRPTHTLPRLLSVFVLAATAWGLLL
jgi:hypothetical protein